MSSAMAVPRPASTVIVVREAAPSFEVLLLKRHDKVAFMGGAFVFPGGRVDEADQRNADASDAAVLQRRFEDLSPVDELTYRYAAVRELREEADVQLRVADLVAFAHWVTPEVEIRRYDTRFYLSRLPAGQEARHDDHETTEVAWLTATEAIARCRSGDLLLPPPTWTTLRQLEPFGSIDALLAWASTRAIVRIQPGFVKDDTHTMLTLPGDPLFPTIPGWEVPMETRFLLTEGNRWLPVSSRPII